MGPHIPGNLAQWPLGRVAQLLDATGPEPFRTRLGHLGLRAGALLTPLLRTPGHGLVVGVGDSRVALDRDSVAALRVRDVPPEAGPAADGAEIRPAGRRLDPTPERLDPSAPPDGGRARRGSGPVIGRPS